MGTSATRAASSIICLVTFSFCSAKAHSTPGNRVEETPSAEQTPRNRRRSSIGRTPPAPGRGANYRRDAAVGRQIQHIRGAKTDIGSIVVELRCHIARGGDSQPYPAILRSNVMPEKINKTEAEWRAESTPQEDHATREKGTERASSR